ncbi:MAG: GxxExxY protein [Proteobacteria bacterium]|nr:GxxExxY protein [Pseudomonadota bacterium]NIS68314.1 GxxExxY protein [Pseudomonadota bacterium]
MDINELTGQIIGAAIEVHKALGPGLLESVYEECLCHELDRRKISFERQKSLPIEYKGVKLDCGYRLGVVVEETIVLELKACDRVEPTDRVQLLTYLKFSGLSVGFLLKFSRPVMRDGIVRVVNQFKDVDRQKAR